MEIYLGNIFYLYISLNIALLNLFLVQRVNLSHFYSVLLKFILLFKTKSIFRYFFNLSGCRIVFLFRAHEQEIYVLLEKFVPFVLTRSVRLMIQIRAKAFHGASYFESLVLGSHISNNV